MLRFCSYLSILFTLGCATVPLVEVKPQLIMDEPEKIRFSGKGAGAGIMLSSSMGPMGIAIGVAIDEGISKTITESFSGAGHSLDDLIYSSFDSALKSVDASKGHNSGQASEIVIHIHKVGYKTTSGDGDPVISNIEGIIQYKGETIILSEMKCASLVVTPVQLAQIKESGDVTYQNLAQHFSGLFECWIEGNAS